MQLGIINDIPSIPVHDALAVQSNDAERAKDAMMEVWSQHITCNSAKPRVSLN
jgi:hypothetical protein